MATFIAGVAFSFAFYLVLSAGSGSMVAWSSGELLLAAVFSIMGGIMFMVASRAAGVRIRRGIFSPVRWAAFLAYAAGPFLRELAKANIDVAGRVITGRIRPGIVRISPGMKTDFGTFMLANSITLTPGTLSVDADGGDLYIHCINLKKARPSTGDICSSFPKWVRRFAE